MAEGNGCASGPVNRFPIDLDTCPKITLAGVQWPIPILGMAQNRIVVPAIYRLGLAARAAREAGVPVDLTTELYDLMINAVHAAMTRAKPGFSIGEFLNMPITHDELLTAFDVVKTQSRFQRKAKEAPTGEPKGPLTTQSGDGESAGQATAEGAPTSI